MSRLSAEHLAARRGLLIVWAGWLLGPAIWALHENLSFVLVPWTCRSGDLLVLHLTTVACLAIVLAIAALSWRSFGVLDEPVDATRRSAIRSRRFLALGGLVLCIFSAAGILAAGIPSFVLDPCWRAA